MSARPFDLSAQELISQDRWLRELVRGLIGESEVDDVVQETWASAIRRGEPLRRPRAWLSVVATNFARRARRSVSRRSLREELAARPEGVPSTEETLELLDLQQHVVRAVRELREPYRTALLLRYTHGLTVPAIAKRTSISEAGVRQRIKRGLDLLREEVGERLGEDWCALPALTAWLIPGGVVMKKSVTIAAALLVLASLGALVIWFERPVESRVAGIAAPADLPEVQKPVPTVPVRTEAELRSPIEAGTPPPPAPITTLTYAGRVLDPSGQPLGGVGIAPSSSYLSSVPSTGLERPSVVSTSNSDGRFELTSELELDALVTGVGWVPIAYRSFTGEGTEALIVAARAVAMGGSVVDSAGLPLGDVSVSLVGVDLRDFEGVLLNLRSVGWDASTTDAAGRFLHRDLPAESGRLRFEKQDYRSRELEMETYDAFNLSVTLEEDELAYVLSGVVLAPNGGAVAGALVGLGERTTRSGADGAFELRMLGEQTPNERDALWAAHEPWQTKIKERIGRELLHAEGKALEIELVFAGETLSIAGRVLDQAGEAVEGLDVYIWRQRELLDGRSAEELAVPEDREVLEVGPGLRVWSRTDADGHFRIDGLGDMEYRLRLFDSERIAALTTEPLRAGDESVTLTLPADFVRAEVTGRVVDRGGAGVAGITIRPQIARYASTQRVNSAGDERRFEVDEEGRFRLTEVSGGSLLLWLSGKTIIPKFHALSADDPTRDIELIVDRMCHFRLVLSGERARANGLKVLDSAGEEMNIAALGGGEYGWSKSRNLTDGKTRVLSVGQSAATLVLYDDEWQELDRLALTLRREDVNKINW